MNLPESYIPILIQAGVAVAFVAVSLLGAHFLGPKQKKGNSVKNQSWECGVPSEGNARTPFSIKYFLTAVLFVLFDIEIVFFLSICSKLQRIWFRRVPCSAYFRGHFLRSVLLCLEAWCIRLG